MLLQTESNQFNKYCDFGVGPANAVHNALLNTGRLFDIRTTLKVSQENVPAHLVSEGTFYVNKFTYEIITKYLTWK